eukprot:2118825-Lingulodinium_polyedra.AAC.1
MCVGGVIWTFPRVFARLPAVPRVFPPANPRRAISVGQGKVCPLVTVRVGHSQAGAKGGARATRT